MKRIEVDEDVFGRFEKFQRDADPSAVLDKLITEGRRRRKSDEEGIALVILEGVWFDLARNPGHASNAPFLEGVCRLVDTVRSYRLNFYDANSFAKALERAVSVPEQRIILYIGEHGSKRKIGSAHALTLMNEVAKHAQKDGKIEGVILSSCMVGSHDDALKAVLKGGANWVFGYTSSVDFIGSAQVESAIVHSVTQCRAVYADTEDGIVKAFAGALKRFNPEWKIGSGAKPQLAHTVRLVVRAKHKQTVQDKTAAMTGKAWP
jgi:hypothetical protein